jgi:hypothetical protein
MWPFRRNPADGIRSNQPYWLMRNGVGDARARGALATEYDVAIIGRNHRRTGGGRPDRDGPTAAAARRA